MDSPVSSSSAARPGPTSSGKSAASITEGTPTRTSGSPKVASMDATPEVTGQGELEPGPQARTAYGGHDGDRRVVDGLDGGVERADELTGAGHVEVPKDADVHPRAEGATAPVSTTARSSPSAASWRKAARSAWISPGLEEVERRTVERAPRHRTGTVDADRCVSHQ